MFFRSNAKQKVEDSNLQPWAMVLTERDAAIVIPGGAVELHSPSIEIGDEGQPSKLVGYRVIGPRVSDEVTTVYLKPVRNQTMLRKQKSAIVVVRHTAGTRTYCGLIVKKAVKPADLKRVDGIGYPGTVDQIYDIGEKSGIWRGTVKNLAGLPIFVELSPAPNLRKNDYVVIVGKLALRNGEQVYEKGAWLQDKARFRLFGSTYKYFCEASQTQGTDDAEVVEAVLAMTADRVQEYAKILGIEENIPPLILPTDQDGRYDSRIAFHDDKVEGAKPKMLEGYDFPSDLDIQKLTVTPLKALSWRAGLGERASFIFLYGLDNRPADDKLELFIRKDYTRSSDGDPSRIGLRIEYDDGGVESFLLGKGPHERFAAHVTDPSHKIFVVKGDIGGDDESKKVLMTARPVLL